ncbi:MAG: glycosyltransferase family 10 [Verrucomicrobiota bacterium]|nr:glycosyltransferase family 10 [Verrucomicrobiota bacterium]
MSASLRISWVPYYGHYLGNRLFAFTNTWTNHWQEGNVYLGQLAVERGHTMGTADTVDPLSADVVVFLDYPQRRESVLSVKRNNPRAKTLLILYESPLENPQWFDQRNHEYFDAVLTYNSKLVDGKRYFPLHLPIGNVPKPAASMNFAKRELLVIINTNRYGGLLAQPRPWHYLNRLKELRACGWRCTLHGLIHVRRGDLNPHRRRLARASERLGMNNVTVYGSGWEGRKTGWYYRLFPDKPYALAHGPALCDKLELIGKYRFALAYENYAGNEGYISEKLFDALYAGTVPVYYGDSAITKYAPAECFVDGRLFRNAESLLKYLNACPSEEWDSYRSAGQAFVQSAAIRQFQPDCYARNILDRVEALVHRHDGN